MKRTIIIGSFVLVAVAVLALILFGTDSKAPRFVPAPAGFKVSSHSHIQYPFLLPNPFEGGLVWIDAWNKDDNHSYLYDLEQKKVLGELVNGWPVFGNRDQSKVLLRDHLPSGKMRILGLIERITGVKFKLANRHRKESFVVLDRKESKARPVGRLYQLQGSSSRWFPSPTYRYGFTSPTVSHGKAVAVCDLDKASMREIKIAGYFIGWWNETKIFYKSDSHDLAIHDVESDETSTLITSTELEHFLQQHAPDAGLSASSIEPFMMWEGDQYQFYLTEKRRRWEATNSFLAKIEKPSGKLKWIDTNFKFEWSDHFDATGWYYLHGGRDFPKDKPSGVYVRDLQTGTTHTLVPDIGINRHSIPHWFGTNVIYVRSNMLWQVSLTDTNPLRVFPPDE